jgi:hypothetical protein
MLTTTASAGQMPRGAVSGRSESSFSSVFGFVNSISASSGSRSAERKTWPSSDIG